MFVDTPKAGAAPAELDPAATADVLAVQACLEDRALDPKVMGSLEVIARNRWHEPLSTWPAHNENHKTTLAGNSLFDGECLRCWLERVAVTEYENISRIGGEDYVNDAFHAMLGEYILNRVVKHFPNGELDAYLR